MAILAFLGLLVSFPTQASHVIVPDHTPTIQQAVNLLPDTVLVRPGTYQERVVVFDGVVLLGLPDADVHPIVAGLSIAPSPSAIHNLRFIVGDLAFTDQIVIDNSDNASHISLDRCRLEGGIADHSPFPATARLELLRSKVGSAALLIADGDCVIDSCEFESQVVVGFENCNLSVDRSWFHGNGTGFGLSTNGGASDVTTVTIKNSLIEQYGTGLAVSAIYSVGLDSVVVRDCNGWGMYARSDNVSITSNRIERCGDYGIYAVAVDSLLVGSNIVTEGRGTGLFVITYQYGAVMKNVVSQNVDNGIFLSAQDVTKGFIVANNSSCLNGGSGFLSECTISYEGSFDLIGNIGFNNAQYGIRWGSPSVTSTRCNDWFGNALGAGHGRSPSSEDYFLDPDFCNASNGDFGLRRRSPLLSVPACGEIGALGAGCKAPELNQFAAERVQDGIQIVWELVERPELAAVWLERSESADGPWIRPDTERHEEELIVRERDRGVFPDRVYWYRVVSSESGATEVVGEPIVVDIAPGTTCRLVAVGPSPARGPVRIEFELNQRAVIDIQVFDIQGRLIASPASGAWGAGKHRVEWSSKGAGSPLAGGVYLVRYRFPGGQDLRRIILRP